MFGPSLFGSMFGGQDPFAQMDAHFRQMTQNMGFGDPFFGNPGQQQQQQHSRGPGVQIEEVGSDEDASGHQVASGQPYVEEASDEEDPHKDNRRARRARHNSPPQQQQQQQQMTMPGFGGFGSMFGGFPNLSGLRNAPGATGYSYSSCSFQSSGPNGVTYHATNSTRAGPNGVRESHSAFHDGRTGRRDVRIARGIKDRAAGHIPAMGTYLQCLRRCLAPGSPSPFVEKGRPERILHRIRDATGREDAEEILKGMTEDEVDRFDREWQEQAEKNLMWGGGRRGPSLGYQQQQQQQQQARPALTAGTGGSSRGGYGSGSAGAAAGPGAVRAGGSSGNYAAAPTSSYNGGMYGGAGTPGSGTARYGTSNGAAGYGSGSGAAGYGATNGTGGYGAGGGAAGYRASNGTGYGTGTGGSNLGGYTSRSYGPVGSGSASSRRAAY